MAYTDATAVYSRTGLTSAEVDLSVQTQILTDAEAELEMLTGRKYTSANAITEYINIKREDILGNKQTTIILSNFPIQSITSFLKLDSTGATETTYANLTSAEISAGTFQTTNYWLDVMEEPLNNSIVPTGRIVMKTDSFSASTHKVKIAYTYGYGSVPANIKTLATCLAGIRTWIRFLGGSYNRLNSYSIPQQNVNKGDFYARGQQMIDSLQKEADALLDRIGRKPRTMFFASGSDR